MAAEYLERVGARLRALREEKGLSRNQLAREMPGKVNENQIYRWEKGKHEMRSDTMEWLAGFFDVDVSHFLCEEPQPIRASDPLPTTITPELAARLDRIETVLAALAADRPLTGEAAALVVEQGLEASARAARDQDRQKGSTAADA